MRPSAVLMMALVAGAALAGCARAGVEAPGSGDGAARGTGRHLLVADGAAGGGAAPRALLGYTWSRTPVKPQGLSSGTGKQSKGISSGTGQPRHLLGYPGSGHMAALNGVGSGGTGALAITGWGMARNLLGIVGTGAKGGTNRAQGLVSTNKQAKGLVSTNKQAKGFMIDEKDHRKLLGVTTGLRPITPKGIVGTNKQAKGFIISEKNHRKLLSITTSMKPAATPKGIIGTGKDGTKKQG